MSQEKTEILNIYPPDGLDIHGAQFTYKMLSGLISLLSISDGESSLSISSEEEEDRIIATVIFSEHLGAILDGFIARLTHVEKVVFTTTSEKNKEEITKEEAWEEIREAVFKDGFNIPIKVLYEAIELQLKDDGQTNNMYALALEKISIPKRNRGFSSGVIEILFVIDDFEKLIASLKRKGFIPVTRLDFLVTDLQALQQLIYTHVTEKVLDLKNDPSVSVELLT